MNTKEIEFALRQRLTELREYIAVDPLSNPVRQLAHELSIQIESEELSAEDLSELIKFYSNNAFLDRSRALKQYLSLSNEKVSEDQLSDAIRNNLNTSDFETFCTFWRKTRDVIVFTGHPTFILSKAQREALAKNVSGTELNLANLEHYPDSPITLKEEHEAALCAMEHASNAISLLHRKLIENASASFPDRWRSFSPAPMKLATWVGYDMDGRSDIGWQDVIRHRLIEKVRRVELYENGLSEFQSSCQHQSVKEASLKLKAIKEHSQSVLALLESELSDASDISIAANQLTDNSTVYSDLNEVRACLTTALVEVDSDSAKKVATLLADMHSFNLGMGHVHFRLNAAQIRNAARQVLNLENDEDLFGRSALEKVQKLIRDVQPVQVNFASLAMERSDASRLIIAMAQILKHIDAEQPIRLLIAELENPVTVLTALYLTKLFGIDDKVDICPLFETPRALDRSRRILDVLFQQVEYRRYVDKRGAVCIQAGFSDAGRFMGQIPAALAIERLQGHLADLMDKHDLGQHEAVLFNTHGESMGRGNHQCSFEDRALYALSPWARKQFSDRDIALVHESSFQGGDGYLLFGNKMLAISVVSSILEANKTALDVGSVSDPFYEDISTSLDFYRTVKSQQESLYADQAYQTTISAIGLAFLPTTGSRQSKRQSVQDQEDMSLRRIRAIPHNAILQQMGLLANLTGGIGRAISAEQDYFIWLKNNSDRFNRLMRLVTKARGLSEIKIFIAYMKIFDGSFWATRPLSGKEPDLVQACALLARELSEDRRYFAALQLAAQLRSDSIALSDQLDAMELRGSNEFMPADLDILHAIRIAIIQHLFVLAANLPDLSPYAGAKKEDILRMVFRLQVDDASDVLTTLFPQDSLGTEDFTVTEPATYPDDSPELNDQIHSDFIEPLKRYMKMVREVTSGISNFYGALG
ncbi:MAG: phosphoenolpyruvate carboxylase [Aquisalinus sp.]|nr:phosphoenolpyruvate carboxylase [Aquisalinus sp.]